MSHTRKQTEFWRGGFGDSYTARNQPSAEAVQARAVGFAQIWRHMGLSKPRSILEGGTNIGLNLRALRSLTDATLHAIEPNAAARAQLAEAKVLAAENIYDATLDRIPLDDASVDLAFTCGVLIHVPEEALLDSLRELHRVARHYILCIEYFSPRTVAVPYHGHDDLLFKRDYGSLWMDTFPDLQYVADGFFWRRTTGWDDVNWWLFRKAAR